MKRVLMIAALMFPLLVGAQSLTPSKVMLVDATATGAGPRYESGIPHVSFQAYGATTAATGAATVKLEGSNVNTPGVNDWVVLGTVTLTLGTTSTTDGLTIYAPWRWLRVNLTAISGTGATVTAAIRELK